MTTSRATRKPSAKARLMIVSRNAQRMNQSNCVCTSLSNNSKLKKTLIISWTLPSKFQQTNFWELCTRNPENSLPTACWERNTVMSVLYRAKRIVTDWFTEAQSIRDVFSVSWLPYDFINYTIDTLNVQANLIEIIIPAHQFDDRPTIVINLKYCKSNEQQSFSFLKKLTRYTPEAIIWRVARFHRYITV